jgi:ribosome-associated protein
MESAQESGWMVIDAFDVMVHLFLAEARGRYALERLWRDAREIPVAKILASPPRVAGRRKPAARKVVKRRTKAAGDR